MIFFICVSPFFYVFVFLERDCSLLVRPEPFLVAGNREVSFACLNVMAETTRQEQTNYSL
jgi:hypothetical protein